MNVLLWVLQVVLAWLCVAGGAYQTFKFEELKKGVAAMRELPRGLWTFLGAFGCIAGLGLIVPRASGMLPMLTPIFAAAVALHSLVVTGLYVRHGDRAPVPYSVTMAILAACIAFGRLMLVP